MLIYPTQDILKWLQNRKTELKSQTRAKFYVAVTRARYSVAFFIEDKKIINNIANCKIWVPEQFEH